MKTTRRPSKQRRSDVRGQPVRFRSKGAGNWCCWATVLLDVIGLLEVAAPAEQLNVVVRITASLCNRDDMVKLQIVSRTAFCASPAVSLPYTLAHFSWNVASIFVFGTESERLVSHRNGRLEYGTRNGGSLAEEISYHRLVGGLDFDGTISASIRHDSVVAHIL